MSMNTFGVCTECTLFCSRTAVRSLSVHKHNRVGRYFSVKGTSIGGVYTQDCGPPRTCLPNQTVANFTYGTYVGADDRTVGYVPAFEPFWCGKWSGIRNFTFAIASLSPSEVVGAANFSDVGAHSVLHMTKGASDIWANYQWQVADVTVCSFGVVVRVSIPACFRHL